MTLCTDASSCLYLFVPVIMLLLRRVYMPVGDIIRCEAAGNYTKVFTHSGELLLVSKTLKDFALLLKSHAFIRTHQSHLVNLQAVRSYLKEDGGQLLLHGGTRIPISSAYREQVKQVLQQQLR